MQAIPYWPSARSINSLSVSYRKISWYFPTVYYRAYRDALLIDAAISSLIDKFTDCLQVWVSVCNVWFNNPKHLDRRFCEANKDSVIDLE